MVYVGLDVSLNSVAVCVIDQEGQILKEATVASEASAISQCLQPWRDRIAKIGLEAGPMSEWLTAGLAERGFPALSLEARQVKAALSAMPVKTDRNDARGIAQVVRAERQAETHARRRDAGQCRAEGSPGKEVVTPAAERKAVAHLMGHHGMSERRACKATGFCRMTMRYQAKRVDDGALRERMAGKGYVKSFTVTF